MHGGMRKARTYQELIFINDGTEFTLGVFTSDAKMKGEVARPDSCAAIHSDVD